MKYSERPYYLQTSVSRLGRTGCSMQTNELRLCIGLAAMLHDYGKALPKYQMQFHDNCVLDSKKSHPSFYLHELFSAIIALRVCKGLGLSNPCTFLVSFPVLQHLHSMRSVGNVLTHRNLPHLMDGFDITDLALSKYSDELRLIFDEISSLMELGVNSSAKQTWFHDIRKEEPKELLDYFMGMSSRKGERWLRLYVLVLNPVVIGDNLDSGEHRLTEENQNRRAFTLELKTAIGENTDWNI
ncbi:MAG: hypothetical protein JRN52_12445 [Nitrososphaerota archaeon]|nr:hypothetical protein [Nitrososphaerota archaeon]